MPKTKNEKDSSGEDLKQRNFKMSDADYNLLTRIAKLRGQDRTQYLRDLIHGGARFSEGVEAWIAEEMVRTRKGRAEVIQEGIEFTMRHRNASSHGKDETESVKEALRLAAGGSKRGPSAGRR